MDKVILDQLRNEIRVMTRQTPLYRLLKTELSKRGWWKNKPRGNPQKAYRISKGLEE